MPFKAHMKIDDLVGKKVRVEGNYMAFMEHSHGMPSSDSLDPVEGILKKVNYVNRTEEINSIVLEIGSSQVEHSLDPDCSGWTTSKEIYLYYDGKLVYESWDGDAIEERESAK